MERGPHPGQVGANDLKADPLLDALKPDIQCVRTHWIRGFTTFHLARPTRIVVLMVLK